MKDTSNMIMQKTLDWLGKPDEIMESDFTFENESYSVKALLYILGNTNRIVSNGSHKFRIYDSHKYFPEFSNVSYEYIIHCRNDLSCKVISLEVLHLVSVYSRFSRKFFSIGSTIPLGEKFKLLKDQQKQFLFFIEPFFDDKHAFTEEPDGQIIQDKNLLQFLWAIPIYESEVKFILSNGFEVFAEEYLHSVDEISNWNREAWV